MSCLLTPCLLHELKILYFTKNCHHLHTYNYFVASLMNKYNLHKISFWLQKTQISIKSKNLYIFSNIKVFHPKVCKQINENYKQISLLHEPASLKLLSRIILSQGVPSFRKRMQLWSVKTQTFSVTGMASMMFPGPV